MGRKNRRIVEDLYLSPLGEERRSMPRCGVFPRQPMFITGYHAQAMIDDQKLAASVYECSIDNGGCGFFHIANR